MKLAKRIAIGFLFVVVVLAVLIHFFLLVFRAIPEVFQWGPGMTFTEILGALAIGAFVVFAVLFKCGMTDAS